VGRVPPPPPSQGALGGAKFQRGGGPQTFGPGRASQTSFFFFGQKPAVSIRRGRGIPRVPVPCPIVRYDGRGVGRGGSNKTQTLWQRLFGIFFVYQAGFCFSRRRNPRTVGRVGGCGQGVKGVARPETEPVALRGREGEPPAPAFSLFFCAVPPAVFTPRVTPLFFFFFSFCFPSFFACWPSLFFFFFFVFIFRSPMKYPMVVSLEPTTEENGKNRPMRFNTFFFVFFCHPGVVEPPGKRRVGVAPPYRGTPSGHPLTHPKFFFSLGFFETTVLRGQHTGTPRFFSFSG